MIVHLPNWIFGKNRGKCEKRSTHPV